MKVNKIIGLSLIAILVAATMGFFSTRGSAQAPEPAAITLDCESEDDDAGEAATAKAEDTDDVEEQCGAQDEEDDDGEDLDDVDFEGQFGDQDNDEVDGNETVVACVDETEDDDALEEAAAADDLDSDQIEEQCGSQVDDDN